MEGPQCPSPCTPTDGLDSAILEPKPDILHREEVNKFNNRISENDCFRIQSSGPFGDDVKVLDICDDASIDNNTRCNDLKETSGQKNDKISMNKKGLPHHLYKPLIIINPNAAHGRFQHSMKDMVSMIQDVFYKPTIYMTKKAKDAEDKSEETISKHTHEVIYVISGDGTANEVINGIMKGKEKARKMGNVWSRLPTLGIFPAGTGGDFRKVLTGSKKFKDYIRMLPKFREYTIDIGKVTMSEITTTVPKTEPTADAPKITKYFLNESSVGYSGYVNRLVNNSSKRCMVYVRKFARALMTMAPSVVKVELKDISPNSPTKLPCMLRLQGEEDKNLNNVGKLPYENCNITEQNDVNNNNNNNNIPTNIEENKVFVKEGIKLIGDTKMTENDVKTLQDPSHINMKLNETETRVLEGDKCNDGFDKSKDKDQGIIRGNIELQNDGWIHMKTGGVFCVFCCNGWYAGGGMCFANGYLDDGYLDINYIKIRSTMVLVKTIPDMYKHFENNVQSKKYRVVQAKKARLTRLVYNPKDSSNNKVVEKRKRLETNLKIADHMDVDGETPGGGDVLWEVVPGAINIVGEPGVIKVLSKPIEY